MLSGQSARRPSLWRTALLTSAAATAAVWIYAWVASRRHTEDLVLVGALVATPITTLGGLIAGAVIHAMRVRVRRLADRDGPNFAPPGSGDEPSPTDTLPAASLSRSQTAAIVAAVASAMFGAAATRQVRYDPATWIVVAIGGGAAAAFGLIGQRLGAHPSSRLSGFALGVGSTAVILLLGVAVWAASLGMLGTGSLFSALWPLVTAGGVLGLLALCAVLVASVELVRGVWRVRRLLSSSRPLR